MGTTRHFHVVFDVRVLDLNLSIIELATALEKCNDYTGLIKANFPVRKIRHVVKHGLDLGLDWTCKPWTGLVKHGLDL